ncbi:MAG: CRISPR-associated helicase Cas3' [Chitinophagaceae bacterium]
MSNNYFDQFFAKSDGTTTLEMHTRHVITAGQNLLQSLPLEEGERRRWEEKLFRCAVLHDFGKIHKDFVSRLNGQKGVNIRHELISLLFCINYLDLEDDELFAIATHHKGVVDTHAAAKGTFSPNDVGDYIKNWYDADCSIFTEEYIKKWLETFKLQAILIQRDIVKEFPKEIKMLLNAKYQIKAIKNIERRKHFSLTRSLLMAADHLGSARKENDIPKYKQLHLLDFQPTKDGHHFPFRPFQEKLQHVKTDVILHAPTGSGKTEAALNWIFANQTDNSRVFYLLPYTASINAMVSRLQKHYNEEVVTALHSKTLDFFYEQISEEYSNEEKDFQRIEKEAKNKRSLSKELFYPIKVATLFQVLKTSLKGKGWEFSLFDYKNALFIIDEFHTYNALLTGMLLATIKLYKKLFNAKFFFLSATIPDFLLDQIINEIYNGDHSILIRPDKTKEQDRVVMDRKRHQLYCLKDAVIEEKSELIQEYLRCGKSVLVIVNNVKTAQKLYKEIKYTLPAQLLHSGFNKRDRTIIEKSITSDDISNRPQFLIATQAVEVSLDIDYDVAFIENAPIDALIQRFGRINRAGKKKIHAFGQNSILHHNTVPVYLFEKSMGRTPFYDENVLKETWNRLSHLNALELGEDDLIKVCNQVYKDGYNEIQQKDFETGLNNSIIRNFEEDWIAGHWRDWVDGILENNNQKIEVLCYNLVEEYEEKVSERRFLEANQLLVQVYRYEADIQKNRKPGDVLVAGNLEYNPTIGYHSLNECVEDQMW